MRTQMPTVIVDSGASVDDREDSMQMLRDQIHAQNCEIKALRTALMYVHPKEDRLKLIGTLKWAEDLLRDAGHDEAVSDVQDCIMLLRKAQEK